MEIRGSLRVPDVQLDQAAPTLVTAICDELTHEGAELTQSSGESVSFRVPWRHEWIVRPRLLPRFTSALDGGTITVKRLPENGLEIRYRFGMWGVFVFATVGVPLLFGLIAAAPWQFIIGAWLWIFGANYAVHWVRARFWLRARVREALRLTEPLIRPHDAST